MSGAFVRKVGTEKNAYGMCPKCGKPGVSRERRTDGNDTCAGGHSYPSKSAVGATGSAGKQAEARPWPFGETTNNLTMRQKLEKSIAALRGSQNTPRPATRPALTPGEWMRPKAPATNAVPPVTNSVKGASLLYAYGYLVGRQCGKNASLTMKQPTGLTRKIPSAIPKVGLTQARPVTMPPAKLMQKRPSAFNR